MKKIGICFGGYCPLHRGHLDVIMKAKKENDICYIVVCGYDNEPRANEIGLDLEKRFLLIREYFKDDEIIRVIKVNDTELGIDESMSASNWKIWSEKVKSEINNNYDIPNEYIHYYVAEESYKDQLEWLGYDVTFIPKELPISGTLIRRCPVKYWSFIASIFRPYLVKRILITGTASEGKTTLVKDISRYFECSNTLEYGREFMEEHALKDPDLTVGDFERFLIMQNEHCLSGASSKSSNGLFVADTDNLVTLMYARAYVDNPEMKISEEDYFNRLLPLAQALQPTIFTWDKIFLVKPHNEFVDDGCRYMGQSSLDERVKNYMILKQLISDFGLSEKVIELDGTFFENFETVKKYINNYEHNLA